MKSLKLLIAVWFACWLSVARGQQTFAGHVWKMTVKVLDESGNPVTDAKATIGFLTHVPPDLIDGVTDTNGIFAAEQTVGPNYGGYDLSVGVMAEKRGYYSSQQKQLVPPTSDPAKWNLTATLTLKKIGQPIAMYAKPVNLVVPIHDKPLEFDLRAGDWVVPYGKGTNSDILFTSHIEKRAEDDVDSALTLSFPNPGDGIQAAIVSLSRWLKLVGVSNCTTWRWLNACRLE